MADLPSSDGTENLGKFMAIIAWILVLLLFGLFFHHWIKKNAQPTKPEIVTVEGVEKTIITRNADNQYLTEGSIHQHPVHFLLDTGSTDIVVPADLAEKLKLRKGQKNMAHTAGGKIIVYDTVIEELTIGHIQLHNLRASISSSLHGNDVILGMSALRKIDFYQQGNNLILTKGTASPNN